MIKGVNDSDNLHNKKGKQTKEYANFLSGEMFNKRSVYLVKGFHGKNEKPPAYKFETFSYSRDP